MKTLFDRQIRVATKGFYDTYSDQIYHIVKDGWFNGILHNPRLVLYKMIPFGVIKKDIKKVQGTINALKYDGQIENHWTIDTTRSIYEYNSFNDVADGLNSLANGFHLDRWESHPRNVLLMCEASGYLGVVRKIANDFRIPYVPAKGDMSVQLKIDIAQSITKPTIILYYGDYDTKGIQIPQTIENDMRMINPDADFEFKRMFLNEDDIEEYGLKRDENGGVQMEQLPEGIAIDSSKEFITSLIDDDTWNKTIDAEVSARRQILTMGAA